MNKRRLALVFAIIAIGAALFCVSSGRFGNGRLSKDGLALYGNIEIRQAALGFRVSGRVAKLLVEEGDVIAAGQPLAMLDKKPYEDEVALAVAELAQSEAKSAKLEAGNRPEEIAQAKAKVAELEAACDLAKATYERNKPLVGQNMLSRQAYEESEAGYRQAQAQLASGREALALAVKGERDEDKAAGRAAKQMSAASLEQAKTKLADAALISPSAGTILTRVVEEGAIVSAGQTVYALALKEPVWVRAYVSESELGLIRPGLKAEIFIDSLPGKPFAGQVGFISPEAEFTPKSVETSELRTALVYRLRIIVAAPCQELRQGMPVTVKIKVER